MHLTDQQVLDTVNGLLDRKRVSKEDRMQWLHTHRHDVSLQDWRILFDCYLKITDPPQVCQVMHDHWEGPMICGKLMPCPSHGGR